MDDRNVATDMPIIGHTLDDPRALTVLSTEHWSLLSARSLVYNEAFARAGMFLTFLSASLVALGLLSTATGFSGTFLLVAALAFAIDLFIGLATLGRVIAAAAEDLRYVQGMNRIRHGYHDIVPGLERYFISSKYDDMRGVFSIYGDVKGAPARSVAGILHGFTTTMGMLTVICAAVAGVLGDIAVMLVTNNGELGAIAGVGVLIVGIVLAQVWMVRSINRLADTLRPTFPSPPETAKRPEEPSSGSAA